jgi:parvulin-like peptidyl-prolyl isomerase
MRKLLVSVALATATIAAAVPAAAQAQGRPAWNRGGPDRGQINGLIQDLNRAEGQIAIAQRRNRDGISPREAAGLRREAQQIRQRLNQSLRGGINNREFFELRTRVNRLEQRVRFERNDRDNRRR